MLTPVIFFGKFDEAPHERGQHLCHHVLSMAGSGFLTVAPRGTGVHSAWKASAPGTDRSACAISRLVHEGFFHRFRVSINHRQVGADRAFGTPAPLLPFLERARADGVAP